VSLAVTPVCAAHGEPEAHCAVLLNNGRATNLNTSTILTVFHTVMLLAHCWSRDRQYPHGEAPASSQPESAVTVTLAIPQIDGPNVTACRHAGCNTCKDARRTDFRRVELELIIERAAYVARDLPLACAWGRQLRRLSGSESVARGWTAGLA
jgi:hypothetical protein